MKKAITMVLLLALTGVTVISGCSSAEEETGEPEFAGKAAEAALTSLSQGDYTKHVRLFTEEGQGLLTEEGFQKGHKTITDKIGTYVKKTFVVVQEENGYTVAYYEAEFTKETEPVQVRAIFQEENGEMKLAGFWLNSPKLLE